jgi:ATP-dependent Clp protease ATP-binding subunit ClpA
VSGSRTRSVPAGSFIFAGPTGVGKTELAKTLASFLFDDEDALIRVDMSEFARSTRLASLRRPSGVSSAYEEGGELTEKVRRKPFSVVLFDEIEKAHPDIFNTLLQVLDEGHLTDGQGRKVDFKNTIIIMTTNLGTQGHRPGSQHRLQSRQQHRDQLPEDEGPGHQRTQAAVPSGVPEPSRRHHRVPAAQ